MRPRQRIPLLAKTTGAGLVLGLAYFFFAPRWYEAQITIVPKQSSSGILGAASSMLTDLPVDVGSLPMLGGTEAERISAVLQSRSVTDAVIAKFNLIERYDKGVIEKTREKVWKLCETEVERKANIVTLRCEDKEPQVARDMAEYFGVAADETFRRVSLSSASEEARFLEKRVAEARLELDSASQKLRQFQEKHKIIDLPEQSKAVVSAMAALEADLITKRLQLSYLDGFASRDEVTASQLRRQIALVQEELHALERQNRGRIVDANLAATAAVTNPAAAAKQASGEQPAGGAVFPAAGEVPALRFELEALFRDQKIRETVFFLLIQQYELTRIGEARDLSTFGVVDHAALPTYKIHPRLRHAAIGVMAGLLLGLGLVTVPIWWRELKRRAEQERLA